MESQTCLPGRSQQILLISSLLGERGSPVLPGLFIYGHTSCGKTVTLKHVLKKLGHNYISINCVECYSARILYETILLSLFQVLDSPQDSVRCDNMHQFITELRNVLSRTGNNDEGLSTYILFEKAEKLRDRDATLIPALLRLQELSGCNVGVILESEIVWEKFRGGTGFLEPIVVHFTDYTKDELLDIICLDAPVSHSQSLYRVFSDLLLSVFFVVCRNLNELRYQARCNFVKFVEPIEKGEVSADNVHKLWRNIEPHLKSALQMVYMRQNSRSVQSRAQSESMISRPSAGTRPTVELPVYSKYLLIAAFLASFNPAKSDKKFFVKLSGKTKKRAADVKKCNERTSNLLLGPKFFPLDRLLAILYSIIDEKLTPSANIYCQISTLVTLGLLSQSSGSENLDAPKYKCLVSLDFIKTVSREFSAIKSLQKALLFNVGFLPRVDQRQCLTQGSNPESHASESVNFEVVRYIYDLA